MMEQLRNEVSASLFAPAERADHETLQKQIFAATSSTVADTVLRAFGGIVLILNTDFRAPL